MTASPARLSFQEKLAYGLGDTACNLSFQAVNIFLFIYYTDVFGLPGSGAGVRGVSLAGTGVLGYAVAPAQDLLVLPADRTGVYGYSNIDTTAVGVHGQTIDAIGVKATAISGTGVVATATTGTGGLFSATTGTALHVAGKAKFSRSGKATVLKTRTYTDITVTDGLTTRSVVHATLQTYRSGVAIAAVRLNYPNTGKARIYLTKVASTTASTYVGWFVAEY